MTRNDIIVGTGWYSDKSRSHHLNQKASKKPYYANWFEKYWRPQIEKYILPQRYFCYSCLCPIPNLDFEYWELVVADKSTVNKDHRYNYHAALLMGAVYAFSNSKHFLWIEQDCMVHGLDKALYYAYDKKLCAGFGQAATFKDNWAAQSFIWIHNDYLPEFIHELTTSRIHESKFPNPEIIFYNLFKDEGTDWGVGYDRKPITNWDQPYFYAQQMTDNEIEKIRNLK